MTLTQLQIHWLVKDTIARVEAIILHSGQADDLDNEQYEALSEDLRTLYTQHLGDTNDTPRSS